jgi:hypothetical protein
MLEQLMPMLAAAKPEQEIVVEVHDLSRQLVESPDDQQIKKKLAFHCQLFILKTIVNDDLEKALDLGIRAEKDVKNMGDNDKI